jgi:NAD(P)-dependent dehydrogenase (short-subunit alcohol dehydrogenase family)
MMLLEGRTAVITGAASGIGRATALRMAAEGARVVLADINEAGLAEVHEAIGAAGGTSSICPTNVADDDQAAALIDHAMTTFSGVDVLHNNAAAVGPEMLGKDGDLAGTTLQTWDDTFAVTLRGQFLCARHAIGPMVAAGRGSIVNMSSGTSLGGDRVRIAYSAAKAGVNSLDRHAVRQAGRAMQCRGSRIRADAAGSFAGPSSRHAGLRRQLPDARARRTRGCGCLGDLPGLR